MGRETSVRVGSVFVLALTAGMPALGESSASPRPLVTGTKPADAAITVPAASSDEVSERLAYLAGLQARLHGGIACFPADLPDDEKRQIIEMTGALPPSLGGRAELDRLATASTVWTGEGMQGPAWQARRASLTYSFPSDGVLWGIASRPVVPNDLNSALCFVFGGTNLDLGREMIRQALAGWRRTSGLSYREVADNDTQQDPFVTRDPERGDCRIGAGFAWPDSYLAYNFFPTAGSDMFFNSWWWDIPNTFSSPNNSYRYLRNVAAHEHGHGLGFIHAVPCLQTVLMEPFISVAYDTHQIDDLRNVQRSYGDRFAGNHSAATAADLGDISSATGTRSYVFRTLSTNGAFGPGGTNEDWFRFTMSQPRAISIIATPTGGTYVNGAQQSGCGGTTATVNATSAGNLRVDLLDSGGAGPIATSPPTPAGMAEILNLPMQGPGTYTIRIVDEGPNDPVNQVVQTYDLEIRVQAGEAPPRAIAGVSKRIGTGTTCFFIGDLNSSVTETGFVTITSYDWDLDGDGTFEVIGNARPTTVYTTPGVRHVTLRVTDSNGLSDTDTIDVDVYEEPFAVYSVAPYPMKNAHGTTVPITIYGKGFSSVTSLADITMEGPLGTTLTGSPVVSPDGSTITGVSVVVAPNAPPGTRVITVHPLALPLLGAASFHLYPVAPGPFAIIYPENGATTPNAAPIVRWQPSDSVAQYLAQIATDSGFVNLVHTSSSLLTYPAWQTGYGVLSPNTTYFLRVRARNETGLDAFTPTVMFTTGPSTTGNNNCANAFEAFGGANPFNSANSTTDGPDEPACLSGGYSAIGNDIWFRYVATCDGSLTATMCVASHDSMMAVYQDACPASGGVLLACNDDYCGVASGLSINNVQAGRTYYIRLGGWQGARGSGILVLSCSPNCTGDADADGAVGLSDIALMLLNWTFSVTPGTSGDITGDGSVGLEDLSFTINHWGETCN